ncbi:RNA pseudouridine synthase [bacterium]|nr:RNA pseudouridine synthase [bacterium]
MIQIVEENKYFIVLIKPEGFSVHNQSPSVAEWLKKASKPLHFVNRLDQDTSGLMVVAKDPEWHNPLAEALDEGQKFYRALLRNPWKKDDKDVTWSWAISDKAEGRQNPKGISSERQEATTQVNVLRTNQYFTEVYIELMTGRMHQIRKHAAIAGHPVVGDSRYNDKKYNENIAKLYNNSRMHLHAEKLMFTFEGKDYDYEKPYRLDQFFKV